MRISAGMGKFGDQVSVISMTWVGGDHLWGAVGRGSTSRVSWREPTLTPSAGFTPARASLRGISASSPDNHGAAAQAVNQLVGTAGLAAGLSRLMPQEDDK
jgi:hypothetical protein